MSFWDRLISFFSRLLVSRFCLVKSPFVEFDFQNSIMGTLPFMTARVLQGKRMTRDKGSKYVVGYAQVPVVPVLKQH